jgi:hypothetical protein
VPADAGNVKLVEQVVVRLVAEMRRVVDLLALRVLAGHQADVVCE